MVKFVTKLKSSPLLKMAYVLFLLVERAIAKHEVREIEQRHTIDGSRLDAPLDEDDDVVIIYNRVPKTASTSFTNIAYDLCARNKYHVLHINTTKNNPVMSLQDQVGYLLIVFIY